MIPKITIVFNRRKTATDTRKGSIDFSISHDGKRRFLSSGISVTTKEWRNGLVVGKNAVALNKQIRTIYDKLNEDIAKMVRDGEIDILSLSIGGSNASMSIMDYLPTYAKEKGLTESTVRNIRNVMSAFRRYGIANASQLKRAELQKAIDRMVEGRKGSTMRQYIALVMSVAKSMRKNGIIESVPRVEFRPQKSECSIKFLTEEQVGQLAGLELSGRNERARDIFLFAVYTGLSYSDIQKISKNSVRREKGRHYILSSRQKTKMPYKVLLSAKALSILERYGYDVSMQKDSLRRGLEQIGNEIGLPFVLSIHKGRHTFATIALNHGIPIEIVSKMLAHSNIATTQIYAKVLQRSVDEGYDKLEQVF